MWKPWRRENKHHIHLFFRGYWVELYWSQLSGSEVSGCSFLSGMMQCLTWLNLDMISSYSELYFFKCIAIFNSFSEVPINHPNETSAILKVMVMGMFWTPWIFLKEHIRHLWSWKTVWKEKYALFWNYSQKQLLRKQTHFNENQTWVSKTNGLDLLWLKLNQMRASSPYK